MKKFTSISAALLLGGLVFGASAATVTTVQPSISPAPGKVVNDFPNSVIMQWGNASVALNSSAANYDDGVLVLDLKFDGNVVNDEYGDPANAIANAVYWNAAGEYWADADASNPGTALRISQNLFTMGMGFETMSVVLPEGCVYIGGTDTYNAGQTLTYEILALENEFTAEPSRGSQQFSVSEVTVAWADNLPLSINKDNSSPIVYGAYDFVSISNPKEAKSVVINDDGTATIQLGEAFNTTGALAISVPDGFFNINVGDLQLPNEQFQIIYFIVDYATYPANQKGMFAPAASFAVYGSQSAEFTGNVADITVTDNEGETVGEVVSYASTTVNGYPGVQFNLKQALDPQENMSVNINIPGGSMKINGSVVSSDIAWEVFVHAAPEVSPAPGIEVSSLSKIDINWGGHTPTITRNTQVYPTLSFGANTLNLSDYAKIEYASANSGDDDIIVDEGNVYAFLQFDLSSLNLKNPGQYTLTVPAGYVSFVDYSGDTNPEMVYTWTMTGDTTYIDAAMSVSPVSGSTMAILGYVDVEWAETLLVPGKVDLSFVSVTLDGAPVTLGTGDDIKVLDVEDSNEQDGGTDTYVHSQLKMYFGSLFNKYGEVVITVKEGAVTSIGGNINKEFSLNYTLVALADYPTWTPASNGTYAAGELVATATWSEGAATVNQNAPVAPWLESDTERLSVSNMMSIKDGAVVFDFTKLNGGNYSLTIPEGYFYINGKISPEIYYDFTIQGTVGVSTLGSEDAVATGIYNLQGVKMHEDVKNLKPGLYIINGKKVMVK